MQSDMNLLAVDLGGSHTACALIVNGVVVDCEETPISNNSSLLSALQIVKDTLHTLVRRNEEVPENFVGIAFSFCGLVDSPTCRILSTSGKYQDYESVNLCDWADTNFGLPLRLENDARLALLGERFAGVGRRFDDIIMITLGTGIGGAAMVEGRLIRGKHAQAGCLGGHFTVNYQGRTCKCGNTGCIEAEASGWSLPLLCAEHSKFSDSPLSQLSQISFADLFRQSASADPCAVEVRDHCLKVWAAGAVSLIHAYDPELVIFGGGCMKSANQILPQVNKQIQRDAWTPWGRVQVHAAMLGNQAPLYGAVPLFERSLD
jgi:glucokinase